jgi:hypothetical protein
MALFTMPLNEVIEMTGGELEIINGVSVMNGGDIGLGTYPIFDENYRAQLNGMIIDHYYIREIGVETIDMFVHNMRTHMNEIMPFYNKLYLSEQLTFDPLSTINLSTIGNNAVNQANTNAGNATATTNTDASARTVTSETPQMLLAGNKDYASNGVDANSSNNGETSSTESSTQNSDTTANSETTVTGYQGVPSDLIMRYRESLINVTLSVINALEENFMGVLDSGDNYIRNSYIFGEYYV